MRRQTDGTLIGREFAMSKAPKGRRQAIGALGSAGVAWTLGCGDGTATGASGTPTTGGGSNSNCAVTPSETAGPFPSRADLVRSDVREDRAGTPLTLTIRVVNVNQACAPVARANVEIWQCDAAGNYSEYGSETNETYLRGVQTTNANGEVTFTTIYPGWYRGRATHIHVEAKIDGASAKVTQIAFPDSVNAQVYASGAYASRGPNPTPNMADGIFSDSLSAELVTPMGNPTSGYTAAFQVSVAV